MTYRELFSKTCQQGIAPHEVRLLLEHLFSFSQTSLLIHFDDSCDSSKLEHFEEMISKRKTGYPLQYLLGEWEFFGLPFYVGEGVLIPRADTEILVETALELCDGMFSPKICDLCSGSGCLCPGSGFLCSGLLCLHSCSGILRSAGTSPGQKHHGNHDCR